jgi:hypothetical protein
MTVERAPICCRCGKALTSYWVWAKNKDGSLSGQAACGGCAKQGEKAA